LYNFAVGDTIGGVAVILGGGHGELMTRRDDFIPKLMLPVGDKPLVEHQICWLRDAGFETIFLCLGVGAPEVRSRFGDGSGLGVKLNYKVLEKPLGTAGALKALGPASLPEDVLVLNGDYYVSGDLRALTAAHRAHAGLATLAVLPARDHPEDSPVVMGPSRLIVGLPLTTDDGPKGFAAGPLAVLRRGLMHFVADEGPSDLVRDAFQAALKAGESLVGYPWPGTAVDLGTADRYEKFIKRLATAKG
jgi:mannose-1-phosphate guanylyltransferase